MSRGRGMWTQVIGIAGAALVAGCTGLEGNPVASHMASSESEPLSSTTYSVRDCVNRPYDCMGLLASTKRTTPTRSAAIGKAHGSTNDGLDRTASAAVTMNFYTVEIATGKKASLGSATGPTDTWLQSPKSFDCRGKHYYRVELTYAGPGTSDGEPVDYDSAQNVPTPVNGISSVDIFCGW